MSPSTQVADLQLAAFAGLCVALTAVGAIAATDGWRPAALVGFAAAAVAATRVRFAGVVAVAVLVVAAGLTLGGPGIGGDA